MTHRLQNIPGTRFTEFTWNTEYRIYMEHWLQNVNGTLLILWNTYHRIYMEHWLQNMHGTLLTENTGNNDYIFYMERMGYKWKTEYIICLKNIYGTLIMEYTWSTDYRIYMEHWLQNIHGTMIKYFTWNIWEINKTLST